MPTFKTARSTGLSQAMRDLAIRNQMGGELDPLNALRADQLAAQDAQRLSLAEKAREEAEATRSRAARMNDPALRSEYAARQSGISLPEATRLDQAFRGELESIDAIDNVAPVTAPETVNPAQRRSYNTALASTIANLIATGDTNAAQMAAAGKTGQEASMQAEASLPGLGVPDANRLLAAAGERTREPITMTAQGVRLNQETGDINEESQLAGAVRANLSAQAGQRRAGGAAATTRADAYARKVSTPVVGGGRTETEAQKRERNARAARNETAAEQAAREMTSPRFRRDPAMKGMALGAYDFVKRAFEVIGEDGKLVGYYR